MGFEPILNRGCFRPVLQYWFLTLSVRPPLDYLLPCLWHNIKETLFFQRDGNCLQLLCLFIHYHPMITQVENDSVDPLCYRTLQEIVHDYKTCACQVYIVSAAGVAERTHQPSTPRNNIAHKSIASCRYYIKQR